MPRRYPDDIREKIVELLNSGATYDQIRLEVGCSNGFIQTVKRECKDKINDIYHKSGSISKNLTIAPNLPTKEEPEAIDEPEPSSLMVYSKIIVLGGLKTKGYTYKVDPIKELVSIVKDENMLVVGFDDLPGVIDELKAIQKNLSSSKETMEVW